MASGGDLDNCTQVEGATDNSKIGNVGDALKVSASITQSAAPSDAVIWVSPYLLDGSNNSMDVDGSSTQKVFLQAPPAGQIWYLKSLTVLLEDGGAMSPDDFGSGSGLTNGVDVVYERNGTNYTLISDIKTNIDLSTSFPENDMITSDTGWFDDEDVYRGTINFPTLMTLDGDTNDEIRFEINDNLVAIDEFVCRIKYMRVL